MRPEMAVTLGLSFLAALFFVAGLADLFRPRLPRLRPRRPRLAPPRPQPSPVARAAPPTAPVVVEETEAASAGAAELPRLVVRYADGRILKGYSYDFYPFRTPSFHLSPWDIADTYASEPLRIKIKDLKAVFFVRDFLGDPSYDERKEFVEGEHPRGRKVEVRFSDGEMLVGSTLGYDPKRIGFFFFPADPRSNNLKVFAVAAAVTQVRLL